MTIIEKAFNEGSGVLRLVPNWVPRVFCIPGRRIRLHPDDLYSLGFARGGLNERWFASTVPADNGPLTAPNEGLSFIVFKNTNGMKKILFRDAINELEEQLIGKWLWKKYGRFPMFAKFFDNQSALPFHLHHRQEHANLVHKNAKHEAYYFPFQVNNHFGDFPYTFFGFQRGITKEQVKECLVNFAKGDNRITDLSIAYKLKIGTGWDVPPGVLHAPGTLCTYEPQQASDIFSMYQSKTSSQIIPEDMLWGNSPADKKGNYDYLMELIDWDENTNPDFRKQHFMEPKPVKSIENMKSEGYIEKWICYKTDAFSAKELTIFPNTTVEIKDSAAYGLIMIQGHGTLNYWKIETPTLIRYGQLTNDEFFVSEETARSGVEIKNLSETEPIVMLKHFGPSNHDLKFTSYSIT
ncbi:MAG: hypothetical protein ACTSRG_18700 [Candidatus Helarchaeota archaeon]